MSSSITRFVYRVTHIIELRQGPYFVPGSPHVIPIELRQAPFFRTRITTCCRKCASAHQALVQRPVRHELRRVRCVPGRGKVWVLAPVDESVSAGTCFFLQRFQQVLFSKISSASFPRLRAGSCHRRWTRCRTGRLADRT